MDNDQSLPVAQRLREAIRYAKTEAALNAAGRELRAAGAAGELTAEEYADLKALGAKVRIELHNIAVGRAAPRFIAKIILEAIAKAPTRNKLECAYRQTQQARIFCPGEEQLLHEAYTKRSGELDAEVVDRVILNTEPEAER